MAKKISELPVVTPLPSTAWIPVIVPDGLEYVTRRVDMASLGALMTPPSAFVLKTTDQSFASTAASAVVSLAFTVTAGKHYRFGFTCCVSSNKKNKTGLLSVQGPAATRLITWIQPQLTGNSVNPGVEFLVVIDGLIMPTANGTVQVRCAAPDTSTVVTVRAGSHGYFFNLG